MPNKKNPQKTSNRCTLLAVGDTSPPDVDPIRIFRDAKRALSQGDIRFCQAERVFSKRGSYNRFGLGHHSRRDPKSAEAYRWAGFDVVSTAGNHSGDWGQEGFVDTIRVLERLGIKAVGTGEHITRARKPAIIEKNGIKVGFLAYASVIPPQYWATEKHAGVAPLRVNTFYEPYEYQPGCPARIITIALEEDVQAMQNDIRSLRTNVHCVVVSHHWGVHGIPKPLAQYQPAVARAAVAAGADIVLGHHPHCLQGVEVLSHAERNAIVFYSLGNFAMPAAHSAPHKHLCAPMETHSWEDAYCRPLEAGHEDRAYTRFWCEAGIAKFDIDSTGVQSAHFIPTMTPSVQSGQPKPLARKDKRFNDIVKHFKWASEGLPGAPQFRVQGDQIQIYENQEAKNSKAVA